jgi:hypothetical protein
MHAPHTARVSPVKYIQIVPLQVMKSDILSKGRYTLSVKLSDFIV